MTGEAGKAEAGCGPGALLSHPYDPAFRRQVWCQAFDERGKGCVGKEQPLFGVIDYVDDLLIEQPRVDRVADRADPRDRVIELEMAEGIPGECPDAVAGSDPELQQRPREPFGAPLGHAVSIAVYLPFDGPRDDLRVAMIHSRMLDDRRNQERPLRHQTVHRLPRKPSLSLSSANSTEFYSEQDLCSAAKEERHADRARR